jgi:hypothetical protein
MDKLKNKKCGSCKQVKSLSNFAMERQKKDGYSYYCRSCKNKKDVEYRSTEIGYMKARYHKMYRKQKATKRLLTFEEFMAAWEKHKSIYGMKSAWGPGVHNLEQHKPITMICSGKGEAKRIESNLSIDRLDSSKDYMVQNIIFIRVDENSRKKDTSYKDCKIHIKLHEERFGK